LGQHQDGGRVEADQLRIALCQAFEFHFAALDIAVLSPELGS
jgi:hypothetical protein